MIWKNVKNLLIILLVAVNILLLVLAYNYYTASRFTDADTAKKAAEVLSESEIQIAVDLLAVKTESAEILSCAYDREYYLSLVASLLFGKEADGMYLLPSGVRAETNESESALLGYDMSISYTNASLAKEIDEALRLAQPLAIENSESARAFLEKFIALPENSLKNAECLSHGEYVFITANQFENGLPLYDMTCVFGIRNEKIVYAQGKHFFGVPEEAEAAQLLDRINIMFSEKARGESGTVKDISLCYTLYEDSQNDRMMLVPAYEISYDGGKVTAVNAISKEKY